MAPVAEFYIFALHFLDEFNLGWVDLNRVAFTLTMSLAMAAYIFIIVERIGTFHVLPHFLPKLVNTPYISSFIKIACRHEAPNGSHAVIKKYDNATSYNLCCGADLSFISLHGSSRSMRERSNRPGGSRMIRPSTSGVQLKS